VYLSFTGLTEDTEYVLFFFVEDLSGNTVPTQVLPFTTLPKHRICQFDIVLNQSVNPNLIINEFSLITSVLQSRWVAISSPTKFNISNNTDTVVAGVIQKQNVTYVYQLM